MSKERNSNSFLRWVYTGVFFTSLSIMTLEICLTRLFSVTLWYHFAFMVISVALFGIGISGILVYLFPKFFSKATLFSKLRFFTIIYPLSTFLSLMVFLNYPFDFARSFAGFFDLVLAYLMASLPFLFGGLLLSLCITHFSSYISKLYSFDLAGAALGCILVIPLLNYLGAPRAILAAAILAILAGFSFSVSSIKFIKEIKEDQKEQDLVIKKPQKFLVNFISYTLIILLFVYLLINPQSFFSIKYFKGKKAPKPLFEGWNSFSRIAVFPGEVFLDLNKIKNICWGLSPKYEGEAVSALAMNIDATAGTPIVHYEGDLKKMEFLKWEITSLAFHLFKKPSVFVIGPGGGKDILAALRFESQKVEGAEINPLVIKAVEEVFGDFSGHPYSQPGVNIVPDEARSTIKHSQEKYDLILSSLIDTWAATAAGAYTLSENHLYTVEAFQDFLDHLTENGVLCISRFIFEPPRETLRLVSLAKQALFNRNIKDISNYIFIAKCTNHGLVGIDTAAFLLKKKPFSREQIQNLKALCQFYEFDVVYAPEFGLTSNSNQPIFQELIKTENPEKFYKDYIFNVSPTTDDRPFFFQLIKTSDFLKAYSIKSGQIFNYIAVFVMVSLFFLVLLLVALFFLGPLFVFKSQQLKGNTKTKLIWLSYFLALGLAYIMIEIALMQKFILYLGHPVYSLSVVLFSLLLFSGLGSFFTQRFRKENFQSNLFKILILIFLIVILSAIFIPLVSNVTFDLIRAYRIFLTILLILPLGFFMGMAFPLGIKILDHKSNSEQTFREIIPWAWGVNGSASVLGSVGSLLIAMNFGYTVTLLIGATFYLVAFLSLFLVKHR